MMDNVWVGDGGSFCNLDGDIGMPADDVVLDADAVAIMQQIIIIMLDDVEDFIDSSSLPFSNKIMDCVTWA